MSDPRRLIMSSLLTELFTADHLQTFLRRYTGGSEILRNIPAGLSPSRFIDAVADSFEHRGMIRQHLHLALVGEFPDREGEIWRHAARMGIDPPIGDTAPIALPNEDIPGSPVARILTPTNIPTISPHQFFDLQREVEDLIKQMDELGRRSGVESVRVVLDGARKRWRTAAYTVALIGPQRAGKSTLANALIGVDVSPVADYPTTAVPLLFMAGARPEATIHYEDGTTGRAEARAEALQPYAAHAANDGNQKGIRLIQVHLPNPTLARGLALVDLPGLRDSSPRVREVTRKALDAADAVLYVMDASLDRKFAINASMLEDLQALVAAKDRVLVVLNQADDLAETRRDTLRAYVEKELEKHELRELLAAPPMFVSGRDGLDCRLHGKALPESFLLLEEVLWGHLLKRRSTGLHRLAEAARTLGVAASECLDLVSDRSKKGAEATDVARIGASRRTALAAVEAAVATWRRDTNQCASKTIYQRASEIRGSFEQTLAHSPANRMPTADDASNLVRSGFSSLAQQVTAEVDQRLAALLTEVTAIAGQSLDASRALMGLPARAKALSVLGKIPEFTYTGISPDLGLLGGLVGFFISPLVGIGTLLFGFAWAEDQRKRKLEAQRRKLREGFGECVTNAEAQLSAYVQDYIRVQSGEIQKDICVRLDTFIKDGERRLERLGKPLDHSEAARLKQVQNAITVLLTELHTFDKKLRPLLDALG